MEKRGVIEEGRTPPEDAAETQALDKEAMRRELESHVTQRAADVVKEKLREDQDA